MTATTVSASATPSVAAGGDLLSVAQQGFSQSNDSDEVGWAFIVENPDADNAVADTGYQIIVYDEQGTVLTSDDGYIDYVMPGARLGVGGSIFVPEGTKADRMDVRLRPGLVSKPPITPDLTVSNVTYFSRSLFPAATGVVSSAFERPLENIEVFAVGYNADGVIIGGGYAFVSFVLPDQPAGVEVAISSADKPDTIELYPVITSATVRADQAVQQNPPNARSALITKQGWGQTSYEGEIGWGFIVRNPNDTVAADTPLYQVVAYDANGTVLATNSSFLSMVLPGQDLGVGGSFFAPADTVPDRLDFQVLNRYFTETTATPDMLTVEEVEFVADKYTPKVTGVVTNTTDEDLEEVAVYAVAYDEEGEIIGGGYGFVEGIAAHAQAAAEAPVATRGKPATVEMYATVSGPAPQQ
jgi:hypothetical protein